MTAVWLNQADAAQIKIDGGKSVDIQGPVAVNAASHPFGTVNNVDLAAQGYEDDEYFVSGEANV